MTKYKVLSVFVGLVLSAFVLILIRHIGGRLSVGGGKKAVYRRPPYEPSTLNTASTFLSSSPKPAKKSGYLVPNIVHYIWYQDQNKTMTFKFHHMISMMSARRILKPDAIYLHTDKEPSGPYWEEAKSVAAVTVVHRTPPRVIFGEKTKTPAFETSDSNIDRVLILLEHGGIYLDTDVIVIKSFDELRQFPCTLGFEVDGVVCGGIIIAAKASTFLYMWINAYLDDYRVDSWAYNSGKVPSKLAKRYPDLVHIEPSRLHIPNWRKEGLDQIWGTVGFNWTNNYAVHLWYRVFLKNMSEYHKKEEPTSQNMYEWQGAFGEMARFIWEHE